jgi:hypothetical protein
VDWDAAASPRSKRLWSWPGLTSSPTGSPQIGKDPRDDQDAGRATTVRLDAQRRPAPCSDAPGCLRPCRTGAALN